MTELFAKQFDEPPEESVTAHGRVTLLGEHTDYNGGLVLPAATRQSISVWYRRHEDKPVRVYSKRMEEEGRYEPGNEKKENNWLDYVKGVSSVLENRGWNVQGGNLLISGDLPLEIGLGSSSALEVACCRAFLSMADSTGPESEEEIVRICRRAENEFVGVPSGVMDPYCSTFLTPGDILFLNCRSMDAARMQLPEDQCELLLFDTGVRRKLAEEKYADRVEEMEEAREMLLENGVRFDGRISTESLNVMMQILPDPLDRRVRHVVQENERVRTGIRMIKKGNMKGLGGLMRESHRSLSEQYEVSCKELDLMVDLVMEKKGVFGAKMTGAGFGGAVVCLAAPGQFEQVSSTLQNEYEEQTGVEPDMYKL